MPKFIEGVELTQEGMHAIFDRLGHPDIISGCIYNANPTIDKAALDRQGFMPVLTGVSPSQNSGHWIMLIKGPGNDYYLYDPLGQASGTHYQSILARKIIPGTLTVIPNEPGLNRGLCGYWVASAGVRARAALNQEAPPTLDALGQTITQEMQNELTNEGYHRITGWLRAVDDEFPPGDAQADARDLRRATEKELGTVRLAPVSVSTNTGTSTVTTQPNTQTVTIPLWNDFSLYADDTVKNAIRYAYEHYLGTPYSGRIEANPVKFGGVNGQWVYRQHHGLSHTIRTMAYAECIVDEARKAKKRGDTLATAEDGRTLADITPEELKKIMIAQAFFVAGRDDEESTLNYAKYHQQSREAFLTYVRDNLKSLIPDVFRNDEEVTMYADIIEDKDKKWGKTPAHVLIHKGHMVDLMRVKQPPESFFHLYFTDLKPWVGAQGTEAVFAKQRQFFHATHEAVAKIDSNNTEPHLVLGPQGTGFYLIGPDGNPVREASENEEEQGKLTFIDSRANLPQGYRYMRVSEFLALDEVRKEFPLTGEIAGAPPGMGDAEYGEYLNHADRARCENDVGFCLDRLQAVNQQAQINPITKAVIASPSKKRREANADEIAAAGILQQILANPDCIQDNHVVLNGVQLEEAFFRELLGKCDMGIVGTLLNETDINNVDRLMTHERTTKFHSTSPQALDRNIGDEWFNRIRKGGGIKDSLIALMQHDDWYYSRVNAIAQHRDTGSSFKEVLFTALMTPLTSKALVDTHGSAKSPTLLFRGLDLSADIKERMIHQAQMIMANSTSNLFTDPSSELFKQLKLSDLSYLSRRTNISTSTDISVPKVTYSSNTIFEIHDPEGLLSAKQVGRHGKGTENEYSFYLPDDVSLVPIQVKDDGKVDATGEARHKFTFVAIKSPDFMPKHESGYAVGPYLQIQASKVAELGLKLGSGKSASIVARIFDLQEELAEQRKNKTDLRAENCMTSCWSGRISKKEKASQQLYKDFLRLEIQPILDQANAALETNDMQALKRALVAFPSEQVWQNFKFPASQHAHQAFLAIKQMMEDKIMLAEKIPAALAECSQALERQDIAASLQALAALPTDREMSNNHLISASIRREVSDLRKELTSLAQAGKRSMGVQDDVELRTKMISTKFLQKVSALDVIEEDADYEKGITTIHTLQKELTAMRMANVLPDTEVEKLEKLLQEVLNKFTVAYMEVLTEAISRMENDPVPLHELQEEMDFVHNISASLLFLHQELINYPGSCPLDMNALDGLRNRLQTLDLGNQTIQQEIAHLQFNSENLVIKLRQLCDSQMQKSVKTQWKTNLNGEESSIIEENEALALKNKNLKTFKSQFNKEEASLDDLLGFLSKKTPTQLQEGLGISIENAKKIQEWLLQFSQGINGTDDLSKNIQLLEELLTEISKEISTPAPMDAEVMREETVIGRQLS
jgi:effector protein SdeA